MEKDNLQDLVDSRHNDLHEDYLASSLDPNNALRTLLKKYRHERYEPRLQNLHILPYVKRPPKFSSSNGGKNSSVPSTRSLVETAREMVETKHTPKV